MIIVIVVVVIIIIIIIMAVNLKIIIKIINFRMKEGIECVIIN